MGIKKSKLVMLLRAKKGWPYLGMKVCNEGSGAAAAADAPEGFFSRSPLRLRDILEYWNTRLIILTFEHSFLMEQFSNSL